MQVSNKQYQVIVVGIAFFAMLLITRMRYCGDFSLPGKPAKPVATIADGKRVSEQIELSSEAYQGYIEKDAASFGIPKTSTKDMAAVFPYRADRERRVLAPDESIEVLGMKLTLTVEDVKGSSSKHMVLEIENLGHKALAYRVQTRPNSGTGACGRMRQIRHNALAVAAGAKLKRSECLYRKDRTLEIALVETIELPELGYLYLSSMDARNFALDERTVGLHLVPLDAMACRVPQAGTLRNAILSGKVTWRDQADFYARHRCQTYSFPATYKAFQVDGEQPLPVGRGDL